MTCAIRYTAVGGEISFLDEKTLNYTGEPTVGSKTLQMRAPAGEESPSTRLPHSSDERGHAQLAGPQVLGPTLRVRANTDPDVRQSRWHRKEMR